jgi:SWIM/SEC-C metal-binding protein
VTSWQKSKEGNMAKLGTEKKPAVVRVQTEARMHEIISICEEHGWKYIVGIEPDKPEDISDVRRLLKQLKQATTKKPRKKIDRNQPCPCGSGKKYRTCCGKLR